MRPISSRNRGMTLVETIVATAIMSIMFLAMGYLIIFSAKNSYIVHQQSQAQLGAAAAIERIANTLRNSTQFGYYAASDAATSPLLRLTYCIPDPLDPDSVTTGVVVYKKASSPTANDGVVKLYDDMSDYDGDVTKDADWEYTGISSFSITRQSNYWANFRVGYFYRPYALREEDKNNDQIFDSMLAGEFITDVIAKNHNTGESANADYTTSTLTSL